MALASSNARTCSAFEESRAACRLRTSRSAASLADTAAAMRSSASACAALALLAYLALCGCDREWGGGVAVWLAGDRRAMKRVPGPTPQ